MKSCKLHKKHRFRCAGYNRAANRTSPNRRISTAKVGTLRARRAVRRSTVSGSWISLVSRGAMLLVLLKKKSHKHLITSVLLRNISNGRTAPYSAKSHTHFTHPSFPVPKTCKKPVRKPEVKRYPCLSKRLCVILSHKLQPVR